MSPIENFIQYTDKSGVNYVAIHPKDLDLEPWFDEMIETYGLVQLVKMFPYVPLVLNEGTGILETYRPCRYNAKVTNGFHLKLAKEKDEDPMKYAEEFKLNLEEAFPDHDDPEIRDIGYSESSIILNEEDGFKIDNDKLPETISIQSVKNWHPNRDASGNYMSGYNTINYFYNNGPYNPSYPYNSNTYLPSYLPSYRTDMYPF